MVMKVLSNHTTLAVCLVLACLCRDNGIRPARSFALVPEREHSPNHPDRRRRRGSSRTFRLAARGGDNNNNDDDENDDVAKKNDASDRVEEMLAMREASQRVQRRLMMPRLIGEAIGNTIRAAAVLYLVGNFFLQAAGYAVIADGDSVRIGTLDDEAFQMEVNKKPTATTITQQQQQQQPSSE